MTESCHTYEWVMSHIWMSRVTHMTESCHTYEWVVSHIWLSHVAHMNESLRLHEGVMSHIRMSHVTCMNAFIYATWPIHMCDIESHIVSYRFINESKSHVWMCHVAYMISHVAAMNESCHIQWRSHVTCMNASCHTYKCRTQGSSWAQQVSFHKWDAVTYMKESSRIYEESSGIYEWVMSQIWQGGSWGQQVSIKHGGCGIWKHSRYIFSKVCWP